MDNRPFWEFNITDMNEAAVHELKKYQKNAFDVDQIVNAATELKYTREIKKIVGSEFSNPTEGFVRYFAKQIHTGMVTSKVMEQFTPMVKKSLQQYVSELISDRLKSALSNEANSTKDEQKEEQPQVINTSPVEDNGLEFTELEREGFFIVKSILRTKIDGNRIYYRDTQRYLNILLDDNIRKTICRLHLNGAKKYLTWTDESGKEAKVEINSLDNIYDFSEQLIGSVMRFEKASEPQIL